jgi:hypothetical protein
MIQRIIRQLTPLIIWLVVSSILTSVLIHEVSLFHNLLSSLVLLFIFFGSTILVNYKIEKNPKRFIGNFLVMTTLQLLAFLIYELILIFQGEMWWVALHALVKCIILIVLQSINLARLNLEPSEKRVE